MNRIRLKNCFYRFLFGREWRCPSEGKVKLHRHLHFNKKPLSVAQHYKDVIKIMLLLDDRLCIQLLFCKIGRDRLYKRSSSDVNTLPQNKASQRSHPQWCRMWKLNVAMSIILVITGNTYSPSTAQFRACEHGLLTFFWQLKMPRQMWWLYLTSLINQCRLFWSSYCCFEPLTWQYYTKRSLYPKKKFFSRVKAIFSFPLSATEEIQVLNLNSLNCCLVKFAAYMMRTTIHHIKGNTEPREISFFQLPLQEQHVFPDLFSKVAWNLLSISDTFIPECFPGFCTNKPHEAQGGTENGNNFL